jgi:hypothetical protein
MNELEKLIAAARPAGPSKELDARVQRTLFEQELRVRNTHVSRTGWRTLLAVAASALVAAGIGFVCGRLTAQPDSPDGSPAEAPTALVSAEDSAPPSAAPNVTTLPLQDERLASLFLRPRSREGLLGAGPLRVETSQLP